MLRGITDRSCGSNCANSPIASTQPWPALPRPRYPEKKSLAVLPLAPIADDPKLTAFGKGLLEDVTAKLSELSANHDLEVISPRALEDKKITTLADAKKEFGVNLGLAVSLKQDGDLLRASYNLIDTRTDKNLAGDSITAPVSDLFTIEDKLTSGIAGALHINLRTEERQALGAHATTCRKLINTSCKATATFSTAPSGNL